MNAAVNENSISDANGDGTSARRVSHLDAALAHVGQQRLQPRHVEMIVQAFAERLDDDGKVRDAAGPPATGRGRAAAAATAGALAGLRPRQQQRPRRILAKAEGKEGAVGQLVEDQPFDVLRRQAVEQVEDRLVGVGQADQQAVVVVQALRAVAEPLPQPGLDRQAQGQVQAAAERAEQDHLPVAELIARRLDHQRAVGRQAAGDEELPLDVAAQVARRGVVEEVIAPQPVEAVGRLHPLGELAQEAADGETEVGAAADVLAAPERHQRRRRLGRADQDAIGLDAVQSPGVGAQQEHVAGAALVDELLVQLADAHVAGVGGVLAGVGNGAAAGQGQALAAGQGEDAIVDAVPAHARLQGA